MSHGLPVGSLTYSAVPARRRRWRETERKRRETERQRGERRWINHQMIATKKKVGDWNECVCMRVIGGAHVHACDRVTCALYLAVHICCVLASLLWHTEVLKDPGSETRQSNQHPKPTQCRGGQPPTHRHAQMKTHTHTHTHTDVTHMYIRVRTHPHTHTHTGTKPHTALLPYL